jgi:hypothetical protein
MLFSRRKRATAVEPAAADTRVHSNGDAPVDPPSELPMVEISAVAPDGSEAVDAGAESSTPTTNPEPVAATDAVPASDPSPTSLPASLAPPTPSPPDDAAVAPDGLPVAAGDETGDADLDRFFAALRQVVHDARERLPLESDRLDNPDLVADDPNDGRMYQDDAEDETMPGTTISRRPDPVTTTELAPSTAELIASLEADRDHWRERAVVWRERAMGADMLVKTLNAHMSDLRINLEDLRMAMRPTSANTPAAPEPSGSLPAQTPRRSRLDRLLEPGE